MWYFVRANAYASCVSHAPAGAVKQVSRLSTYFQEEILSVLSKVNMSETIV